MALNEGSCGTNCVSVPSNLQVLYLAWFQLHLCCTLSLNMATMTSEFSKVEQLIHSCKTDAWFMDVAEKGDYWYDEEGNVTVTDLLGHLYKKLKPIFLLWSRVRFVFKLGWFLKVPVLEEGRRNTAIHTSTGIFLGKFVHRKCISEWKAYKTKTSRIWKMNWRNITR